MRKVTLYDVVVIWVMVLIVSTGLAALFNGGYFIIRLLLLAPFINPAIKVTKIFASKP